MDWPEERERLLQTISRQQEQAERLAKRFKTLQKTLVDQQKLLDRYQRALTASGWLLPDPAPSGPTVAEDQAGTNVSRPAFKVHKLNHKPNKEPNGSKEQRIESVRGLNSAAMPSQPPNAATPHAADSDCEEPEATHLPVMIKHESASYKSNTTTRTNDPAWISSRKVPDFKEQPPSSPTPTDSTTLKRKRPATASTWAQEKERMRMDGIAAARPKTALFDAKPKPSGSWKEKDKQQQEDKENAYQYVEVVRNREARAALPGHDCVECRKYYEALGGLGDAELQKSKCSRHRARFVPYDTPDGFWNLSFPDSL